MNIALGAVLIFILLIPPIAFYISYTFGRHTRGGLKFSFLDGLLASAIFSLFVHSLSVWLIGLLGFEIRFDLLLKLLGGELKDLELKTDNRTLKNSLVEFGFYNAVILFIMIVIGRKLRQLSLKNRWHTKNDLFRIFHNWWYLFNGYYLDEEEYVQLMYDTPVIDVIVDTNAGTIIYSGMLVGYVCNGEELDRIYLRSAVRRDFKMNADRSPHTDATAEKIDIKEIPGQFICIAYSEIKNMNLRFITVEATEEDIEEFEDIPDDIEDTV